MSFSNDPTDFKQKYRLRTEIYRHALHTAKLDELKENPRFQGDRMRAILSREVPKVQEPEPENQEKLFEVRTSQEREREFSPEFFVPRNSIMSQHNRFDSKTLRKLLKQSSEKESDGEEEGGAYKRLQGALSKIEQREKEEAKNGKNEQSKKSSKQNSRKNSLSQSKSLTSMRKTSVTSKKAKDHSTSIERKSSRGLVVGKSQETKPKKKEVPSKITQRESVYKQVPPSSRRQSENVNLSIGSKKQSLAKIETSQNNSKNIGTKKQVPSKLTIQTRESTSPVRSVVDDGRKQPQTARYEKKNYWREAGNISSNLIR